MSIYEKRTHVHKRLTRLRRMRYVSQTFLESALLFPGSGKGSGTGPDRKKFCSCLQQKSACNVAFK